MKREDVKGYIIRNIEARLYPPTYISSFDLDNLRIGTCFDFPKFSEPFEMDGLINEILEEYKAKGYTCSKQKVWFSFCYRGQINIRKI